jgi:hypothetical protein
MEFAKVAFQLRMSNIPLACMGTKTGFKIGATVGDVEDVDVPDGEVARGNI